MLHNYTYSIGILLCPHLLQEIVRGICSDSHIALIVRLSRPRVMLFWQQTVCKIVETHIPSLHTTYVYQSKASFVTMMPGCHSAAKVKPAAALTGTCGALALPLSYVHSAKLRSQGAINLNKPNVHARARKVEVTPHLDRPRS